MKTIENKKFDKIFLIGMPAAGKTHLAFELAKWLNWKQIDTDKLIERKIGKSIAEYFSTHSETEFRELEKKIIHESFKLKNYIIATGGGLPCFFDNLEKMKENGLTIFLDTDASVLAQRIRANPYKRPMFLVDSKIEATLQQLYTHRIQYYQKGHLHISGEWDAKKFELMLNLSEYSLTNKTKNAMINKILVPFDFSKCAEAALRAAMFIAEKSKAEIFILHVINNIGDSKLTANNNQIQLENVHQAMRDDMQFMAEAILDNMRKLVDRFGTAQLKFSTAIRSGDITSHILRFSKEKNCDFIVMGTQGDENYNATIIGSNTQKITRLAPCPMLMIRHFDNAQTFEKMLLALDFESTSHEAIKYIKEFQKIMRAKLDLMYINTPLYFISSHEANKLFADFIQTHELTQAQTHLYCDLHEDEGIVHGANDLKADLVVVVTNKRKGFARFLSGSVSEEVISESRCPVLVLPSDLEG